MLGLNKTPNILPQINKYYIKLNVLLTVRCSYETRFNNIFENYVTKPFKPLELLARVNSQLRRYTKYMNMPE